MMSLTTVSSHFLRSGSFSMARIILRSAWCLSFQGLDVRILDIVLFSNLVQTIDARITPFQTFNQMRPRTHVLIPRPMKFSARLAQQFLNVHTPSLLLVGGTSWLLISSSFPNHHLVSNRFRLNHDAIFYLVPNFPNRVGLSNVWRHETAFYTLQTPLWSCRGPTLLLLLLGCFGTGSCHLRRGWRGWIL